MLLDQLELPANNLIEDSVVANFSKQAFIYDKVARAHKVAAHNLDQCIASNSTSAPSGNILEVGCGTGILSQYLVRRFLNQKIHLLDPAPNMLVMCRKNLDKHLRQLKPDNLTPPIFIESTIEEFLTESRFAKINFALIASSFTLHWCIDLPAVIKQLVNKLEPRGQLFFSYPVAGSFPEWREMSINLDIPFTANELPCQNKLRSAIDNTQATVDYRQYSCQVNFVSALQFFQEMKRLGATSPVLTKSSNQENGLPTRKLTVGDFRRLLAAWRVPINCTYEIIEGIITRRG